MFDSMVGSKDLVMDFLVCGLRREGFLKKIKPVSTSKLTPSRAED